MTYQPYNIGTNLGPWVTLCSTECFILVIKWKKQKKHLMGQKHELYEPTARK